MPRLGSVNEKVFCASRIDENISLTEGITAWLSSGNEGIYLGSILYRISVSKLINSTQYVFFPRRGHKTPFARVQVITATCSIIQYVYG